MSKMAFWIEFDDRASATIEVEAHHPPTKADYDAAETAAGAFGKVKRSNVIPYPREPRIGEKSTCPSFCYGKGECLGKTACPNRYACSE